MAFLGKVKGVVFSLALFFSSFTGVLFFAGWLLPIIFVNPRWYRSLFDPMIGSWMCYCASLLELFLGIDVVISGDEIRAGERNLLIMNHRTRLDWMYLWSVLARQSGLKTEKIILKAPLKHIPGAGWAMQIGSFMFINRKWEEDKKIMEKMMNYFIDLKHKTQVLIFPEGTDFTAKSKSRSDDFAKRNEVQPYDYVLHPRTTGFTWLAKHMIDGDHVDSIYDISIAYPHNFPQSEPELIMGNIPKSIHFNIKRHPISEIPTTEDGLQEWCKDRWREKDQNLRDFYEKKRFEADGNGDASSPSGSTCVLWMAFVYWTVFTLSILVLLMVSSIARWIALFQIVFYLFMGKKYGGFELFQAEYFNKYFNKIKRSY